MKNSQLLHGLPENRVSWKLLLLLFAIESLFFIMILFMGGMEVINTTFKNANFDPAQHPDVIFKIVRDIFLWLILFRYLLVLLGCFILSKILTSTKRQLNTLKVFNIYIYSRIGEWLLFVPLILILLTVFGGQLLNDGALSRSLLSLFTFLPVILFWVLFVKGVKLSITKNEV